MKPKWIQEGIYTVNKHCIQRIACWGPIQGGTHDKKYTVEVVLRGRRETHFYFDTPEQAYALVDKLTS